MGPPLRVHVRPLNLGARDCAWKNHIQWLAASAEPRHWYPAATAELVGEYQAAGDKAETDTAEETPGAATDAGSLGV
jgi:hypothetical protein